MLIATFNRGTGTPADFDFLKDHDGDVMGFNEPDMYDAHGACRLSHAAHAHLPVQLSFRSAGMHLASCCMLYAARARVSAHRRSLSLPEPHRHRHRHRHTHAHTHTRECICTCKRYDSFMQLT